MTKHVEQRHHALRKNNILQKDVKRNPKKKLPFQTGTMFLLIVVDYQNTRIGCTRFKRGKLLDRSKPFKRIVNEVISLHTQRTLFKENVFGRACNICMFIAF